MMRALLPGIALVFLAACNLEPTPDPIPVPTTFPQAAPAAASAVATTYLEAWAAGDYAAMYALLDPALRERYPVEQFSELHAAFAGMARVETLSGTAGEPAIVGLPAEPRASEFPAPSPTPIPTPDPSAPADPSATPIPTPEPAIDPAEPLDGPVPGLAVPLAVTVASERFGPLELD